jgi:allophanate hydrolase
VTLLNAETGVLLAVAGAHLSGQPLHRDLLDRGGHLVALTCTAAAYRMVALPRTSTIPLPRPGLIRDPVAGAAVEVEVYRIPVATLGSLLLTVAPPLAIGTVSLADGSDVAGFVCEGYAAAHAPDITGFGGWRRYLAAQVSVRPVPPAPA